MDYQECAYNRCKSRVIPHLHGGRPKKYCCDSCRSAAGRQRRNAILRSKRAGVSERGLNVPFIVGQTVAEELAEIRRSRLRDAVMRAEKTYQ